MPDQPLQSLHADVSMPVAKLGKRGRGECNLRQWWQALLDEPFEPAQRSSLVTRRISPRQQLAQHEGIGQG